MAKKPVNKSALVREYLAKYPEKMPTALAQQISQEHGVKITNKFVATVKTKLKHAGGSFANSTPTAKPVTPAEAKPVAPAAAKPAVVAAKKKPATAKVLPTAAQPKPAAAPGSTTGLSQHIANLKAAAQRLGNDEAKRIIDLF